jgi:hypothetical protein
MKAVEMAARLRARGLALALRRAARMAGLDRRQARFGRRDSLPDARLLWPGEEA